MLTRLELPLEHQLGGDTLMAEVAIWSVELEAGIREVVSRLHSMPPSKRQKYPGQKNGVPIFLPPSFCLPNAQVGRWRGQGVLCRINPWR